MINRTGILWALLASINWGLLYNIDQRLLIKTSPWTMFIIGNSIQIIILIPYIFTQSGSKDISLLLSDKQQLGLLFISEIICMIAGISILYAVKALNASTAAIFEIIYPAFVVLFAVIFFGGSVDIKFIVGSILVFIGSTVIMR